jgi:hypothetical protein
MAWYVIAEKYVDQWKPLPINTGRGLGILVFDSRWDTQAFIDANWEISLGSRWEPLELNNAQLARVLEWYADEEDIKWIVRNAPSRPGGVPWGAEGAPQEVALAKVGDIRDLIEVLRGPE